MKLAETWAHSLDVYESMNKEYENTTRIEHVALFGWLNSENVSKENKIIIIPAAILSSLPKKINTFNLNFKFSI